MLIKVINANVKMTKKYQHIIDTLKEDKLETVSKPVSTWREKVYPKPYVWVDTSTLNSINLKKNKCKR